MNGGPVVPDGYRDPRTGLRVRKPLQRRTPIRRRPATPSTDQGSQPPDRRAAQPARRGGQIARSAPLARSKVASPRTTPIRAVSSRRAAEVRDRTEVKRALAPDVAALSCARCHAEPVVDWHERLSRARGGSIVDLDNAVFLGRACHRWITEHPAEAEAEGWSTSRGPTS